MKKIFSLITVVLVFSVSMITVFGKATSQAGTPETLDISERVDDLEKLKNDNISSSGIHLPQSAYTRSNMQFTGGYLYHEDTLTSSDATDMYFFSVPSTKFMTFRINSNNPNYIVELGMVDWEAGIYYPVDVVATPNDGITPIDGVFGGDWALRVYSSGTVGNSYTVAANVQSPTNVVEIQYINADLSRQIVKLTSGEIYQNNINLTKAINNIRNSAVTFNMEDSWPVYPSGTEYYTHDISNGKISTISCGEYYTNEISVKNALWIKLDVGTLWTYTHSIVNNGSTLSFDDVTGQKTPRVFDARDVSGEWGDHYLIYDLDTQKYVDFFSIYNVFFATGGQQITNNTKIFARIE